MAVGGSGGGPWVSQRMLDAECRSLFLLCDLLDTFVSGKKQQVQKANAAPKLKAFIEAHIAVYGYQFIKPKHHFVWHNVLHMKSSQVVLDCWVHERKHQSLKRLGTAVANTSIFESSVLSRAVLHQARLLQSLVVGTGLLGRSEESVEVANAFGAPTAHVARSLSCKGLAVSTGDVVLFDCKAGIVKSCAEVVGSCYLLLSLLRLHRELNMHLSISIYSTNRIIT